LAADAKSTEVTSTPSGDGRVVIGMKPAPKLLYNQIQRICAENSVGLSVLQTKWTAAMGNIDKFLQCNNVTNKFLISLFTLPY
jgi:hypothetical protein